MTPDIQKVADGLRPEQKAALLRAEQDGQLGKYFVRFYVCNHRTRRSLIRAGLGSAVWSGVMLTDAGLSVRQALSQQVKKP